MKYRTDTLKERFLHVAHYLTTIIRSLDVLGGVVIAIIASGFIVKYIVTSRIAEKCLHLPSINKAHGV